MPTDQEIKSYGSAAALHALVERVGLIVRAENAAIGSVSSAPRAITWRASVDGANGFRSLRALAGAEALQRIEASQGFVVFERIDDSAEVRSEREALLLMTRRSESKDLLVFPLRARGALIGALAVQMASSSQVTVEDKVLLESLAELAALTLDNILLFEIVNRTQHVWEQTFDAIQDGIIVYDERPCIRRCNLHAAQLLGLSSPIEAIGLSEKESFARLFGEHAASYHVTKRTGITSSFELQAADGSRYLISTSSFQTASGTESWSVLTWSDITELSAVQDQLSRSRRLAMVGQLAAGVAHEINNPLAAIVTCAETMLLDLSESPEFQGLANEREWFFYLEEIIRQALRGKGITRGLLDLSRQKSAELRSCDINQIVAQCAKLYQHRVVEKVFIATHLDPHLAPVVSDETMLRQILENLVSNALDALRSEGSVTITTSLIGGRVCIEVADTGEGIPADLLPRIFEPFYTTKDVGRGSGLGLAISAALAENLGGSITVESKPGAGSRFRLWVPDREALLVAAPK